MKNFTLSLLLTFAGLSVVFAQVNLDSGLVAHYPFNGNANDESGNGNNGTVNGATLTTDRFGNAGKAYSFDGISTKITTPIIDKPILGSISVWINTNSQNGHIIDGTNGCTDFSFQIKNRRSHEHIKYFNCGSVIGDTLSGNIIDSSWQHIVFIWGTNGRKIYQNGNIASSNNNTETSSSSLPIVIGESGYSPGTGYAFNGFIDDIRIYNRVLTPAEIDSLYKEGGWPNVLSNGLVAHYPFNGNANDESGNGNNGTVNGATLTTDRFGNANKAYSFNLTTDNITASDSLLPDTNQNRSVSLWFKTDIDHIGGRLFEYGVPSVNNHFSIGFGDNTNEVRVSSYGSPPYFEPVYSYQNIWVHSVAMVRNDSTFLFLNDSLILSNNTINIWNTILSNTLQIGNSLTNTTIDDIRIYNRALNPIEIDSLYHQGGWPLTTQTKKMFYVKGSSAPYSIYSANLDGTGETLITSDVYSDNYAGYANGKICYRSASEIRIVNADGTGNTAVPNTTDAAASCNADMSPDGSKIAYTGSTNNFKTFIINPDGTNKITFNDGSISSKHQNGLSWNEAGKIYISETDFGNASSAQIYSKPDIDSAAALTLLASVYSGGPVSGGLDNKIAYFDLSLNLWIMNSDGTGKTQLSQAGTISGMGAWNNTDSTFYYVKNGDIWKIKIDNTGNAQVTTSGNHYIIIGIDNVSLSNCSDTLLSQTISICTGNSITVGSNTYDSTGTYSDTLQTTLGCDSIITTNLFVYPAGQTITDTINKFIHDGRDCRNYPIVKIGNQWWMKENLNASKYDDGSAILNDTDATVWSNLTTGALSYYNNDSIQYAETYGALYNWYAVNDSRGVCPTGWHVSSDNEWNIMEIGIDNTVDTASFGIWTGTDIGGKLKEAGTTHWNSPNTGATNSSMFTALPGSGRISSTGQFDQQLGMYGGWWTATSFDANNSWFRQLHYGQSGCARQQDNKKAGFSIRCLQTTCSDVLVTIDTTVCPGGSVTVGSSTYTVSGTYYDTLPLVGGCDSIVTTNLTVNPVYSSPATASICSGDSIFLQGNYQNAAGTYYDTLSSTTGCDSIIATTLTVNSVYSVNNPQTICNGGSYTINGNTYTTSGTFYDTLVSANGCDSIITTTLTVNPTYNTPETASICSGDSIYLGSSWQTIAGTYYDTLAASNGCDSVITTTLTVNPTYNIPATASICSGDSMFFQGAYQTIAGTYYDTLSSMVNYCDSVIITTLTVNPTATATATATICSGDSVFAGGAWQTVSGSYYDTLTAYSGCDSVITTILTVNSNPSLSIITTTDNGTGNGTADLIIIGGTPPYNYTWSNGATTQDITGLASGTYSVTVADASGCSGTATANVNSLCNITLTITTTPATCGQNDGTASVSATGGAIPYTYQWTSGSTSSVADSLSAGQYMVTVTDAAGCKPFAPAIVSNTNAPAITVNSITDANCYGGSDGAIDISVSGGSPPYTYSWSNGAATQDISGLQVGPYQVAVEDNNNCIIIMDINISQPSLLNVSIVISNASCSNSDGSAAASPSGGISPYTFLWSNGESTDAMLGVSGDAYFITVTDANGCTKIKQVTVNETDAPLITLDSVVNTSCGTANGGVWLTVSTGVPPYTYLWSNGSGSVPLTNVQSGIYTLTVTGSNGCKAMLTAQVQTLTPATQMICILTVDSATMRNKVIWEKPVMNGISHYNIYKESTQAGVYFLAGAVPFDSLSEFTDLLSDPVVRAWRYRMTSADSCGNESSVSVTHKTMHLVLSKFGGSNYMIWDDYEGFSFFTYYINRYHSSTGWLVLDSVPSNLHSYTDASPPSQGNTWYFVEAKHPTGCDPTMKVKKYNASKSNTALMQAPIGIEENYLSVLTLNLFPNPTTSEVTITYSLPSATKVTIEITDVIGKKIAILTDTEKQMQGEHACKYKFNEPGVYFIFLKTENGLVIRKQISL